MLESFLQDEPLSLKVCGITLVEDIHRLIDEGVPALGINFWPQSKRYCSPEKATMFQEFKGKILRVGVFVNASLEQIKALYEDNIIDVAQLHGDESDAFVEQCVASKIPTIRAVGVRDKSEIESLYVKGCIAILLDAHAPGVYGGTGETCDWSIIPHFKKHYPELPIILAGGIKPENVKEAAALSSICALDVASGAEQSPGVKDFNKVQKLVAGLK